jgi:hypothetical protein
MFPSLKLSKTFLMLSSEGKEKRLQNLTLLLRETSQSVKISHQSDANVKFSTS